MKNIISILLLTIISLFSLSAFAFTIPDKPENGWYVVDQPGKLTSDQKNALNQKIENLNKTTKNQYGIAIINTLDGNEISDVGQNIFRSWGIGQAKINNGILLLISVGDKKTRIQTGSGSEGDLPDLLCNDILQKTLKPFLRQGKYYEGIDASIDAISSHMENKTNALAISTKESRAVAASNSSDVGTFIFIVFGLFALVFVGVFLFSWLEKRKFSKLAQENEDNYNRIQENNRKYKDAIGSHTANYVPPVSYSPITTKSYSPSVSTSLGTSAAIVGGIGAAGAAIAVSEAMRRQKAQEREREETARKRRREQEEEDNKRNSYSSSSSSSSSSYDYGSSSSSYDSGSSGSDFGGGSSDGGGSSGDF